MKKIFFLLTMLYLNQGFSQNLPHFESVQLMQKADYAIAEPAVQQAVDYILTTPYDKNDLSRARSLQFVTRWMSGTPDFKFILDESISKMTKGNDQLLGLYMVCMTKYCLDNRTSANNEKLVKLNATKLLLAYCANGNNNMKMTKQLKRLSDANSKGELEKEL